MPPPPEPGEVLVTVPVEFTREIRLGRVTGARGPDAIDVREYKVLTKKPGQWTRRKGFRLPCDPSALRRLADGLGQVADRLEAERAEGRRESTGVDGPGPWRRPRPLSAAEVARFVADRRKKPMATGG